MAHQALIEKNYVCIEKQILATWEASSLNECAIFAILSGSIRKGTLVLHDAIRILKRHGYENIRVVLAGVSRTEKIWPLIEEKIVENGIVDNVVCRGNMNAKQIADALSNSSVFVHPSFIDNSPNSLAEAMIVGTLCVATSVGGVQSMLEHKKEGIFVHREIHILWPPLLIKYLSIKKKLLSFLLMQGSVHDKYTTKLKYVDR